jgi:hypothetical protein
MARSTFGRIAGALALVVAGGCANREKSTQAYGRFQLVNTSWTVPGPCPKREFRHELVAPDGEVVLEWADPLGTTSDGAWSLWRGGQVRQLYAVDHRKDTIRVLPSAETTTPAWVRPGTAQLVMMSIQGNGDDVVLTDLADPVFNRTALCHTQGHVERVAWSPDGSRLLFEECVVGKAPKDGEAPESDRVSCVAWVDGKPRSTPLWTTDADVYGMQWSASGASVGLLEDRGPEHPARIRLLHVRRFDPPDVVAIEEIARQPTDARVEWDGDVPRLRR